MTRKITRICEKCDEYVDEKESCDYLDCAFMFADEYEKNNSVGESHNINALIDRIRELQETINELKKQMQEQQLRLQIIEQEKDRNTPPPHDPFSPWTTPKFPDTNPWPNPKCPVCGIDYNALMWYACGRSDCPNKVNYRDYIGGTWY